ncbi:hypothetical protein PHLGIDRAFT_129318 [Phlebiopsis gigantea 11061_1 CR5-6]|uniref:Major facilitator superfamily (MFS) profile domain-containing protein n=1 Tax=Phlebiopsis gigantea (strain 11061_1 CR5-6) TaxID=745531 RepID=A0A0C3S403_PHLG1|nr:hypothetical protein PHLGIDRAFT_129318 [Phlebiopsis gigantea 11061_1 CR5-6]
MQDANPSPKLEPSVSTFHAKGSALDLRTSSLLDDVVVTTKGESIRQRPGTTTDAQEEVELATLTSRRSADPAGDGVSLRTLETGAHAAAGVAAVPLSPAERRKQERRALECFAALCVSLFMCGWNDGSTGPLLPTIQAHYGIGFALASLLFVAMALGFMIGSTANLWLSEKLGLGKAITFGAVVHICGYGMAAPGGPYPLMCVAYGLVGFAQALQVAGGNSFVGSLKNPSTKLGIMHAAYGLGAFTAPLVATQFAKEQRWSFHYLISMGIAFIEVITLSTALRFKNQEELRAETGEEPVEEDTTGGSKYKQMMGLPALHLLTVWTVIYVGVEVTLGGWIVTFIQEKRDGGASSGYISSGFFGGKYLDHSTLSIILICSAGLMVGRILLLWLNRKIGERRVMFIYTVLAIALEVTIWSVPSLIENAVAVSAIGVVFGPMYPILIHQSQKILPKWLFTGCVGWIAGVGQSGSAILPFITGLLASKFGITSLQPFVVSMMSTLLLVWALVPRVRRVD